MAGAYETTAERQIEALHDKVAGLEAMLTDARAEIERLRAALRPFAEAHQFMRDVCVANVRLRTVDRISGRVRLIDGPTLQDFARATELLPGA